MIETRMIETKTMIEKRTRSVRGRRARDPLPLAATFVAATVAVAIFLAGVAWAGPPTPIAPPPDPPLDPPLETVAVPDLEPLEDAVERQLLEAVDETRAALAEESDARSRADAYGRLGRQLHAYNLLAPAAAAYRNAERLAGGDFRWPYYLGYLHQQDGDLEAAAAAYERALSLSANDLPSLVHLGEVELERGRLDEAESRLRQALEVAPGNPAAWASLGQIALSRGDAEEAAKILQGVLAAVPEADRLHYPLALAYRKLGDAERAREHLERRGTVGVKVRDPLVEALENLASGERVHLLRGRQAYAAGRFTEAAEAFALAAEADPKSARARVNLGSALAGAGDAAGAVDAYRAALAIDPDNATAHFNLGSLLAASEPDAAREHFRRVVELVPEDAGAHRELGRLLRRAGELEQALVHYTEAVAFAQQDEPSLFERASLLVELGRYREAKIQLEAAYLRMPWQGRIAAALARFLAACPDPTLRDGEKALVLADKVYDALPSPEHAALAAAALAELGRCDEAARRQEDAIETARAAGQPTAALETALERYRRARPCRPPVDGSTTAGGDR